MRRASPQQARDWRSHIKDAGCEVRREDKNRGETAVLLMPSKEVDAIFVRGEAD